MYRNSGCLERTFSSQAGNCNIELSASSTNGTMISFVQDEINQPVQNGMMELSIFGVVLQIPSRTNSVLFRQTLNILKELSC